MKKPLLSIVVPVYKVEKYLEECVLSITNQSFKDFEIILVDDGSPDSCPQICDRLAGGDDRIRVLHKKNEGVANARRDGAEMAEGERIVFVDADDYLINECLGKIAEIVRETDVDLVSIGSFEDNGRCPVATDIGYRQGYYSKEDIEKEIFPGLILKNDGSRFLTRIGAIKRQLFLDNAIVNVPLGEDLACFVTCVFHAKSIYILSERCYFHRFNTESMTRGKTVYDWEWPKSVATYIENRIDINHSDLKQQLYRLTTCNLFATALYQFNRDEKYSVIKRDILDHLEAEPYYKEAISKCEFEASFKARLKMMTLQKRSFFPAYIYSKMRTWRRARISKKRAKNSI